MAGTAPQSVVNQAPTRPPSTPQWDNPDWVAENLGKPGFAPQYGSNDVGSFERNYNAVLSNLTPTQLIKRYTTASPQQLGTQLDRSNYQAFQSFKSLFGRDPAVNEYAQVLPAFQGPNGNINGNAYLALLQDTYRSNPDLDPSRRAQQPSAGDLGSSIQQQFQTLLGRDATKDELDHFTQAVQSGQTDLYGISNFLKQMPEYTNAQDTTFRQGLSKELEGYDTSEFNRERQDITADYARRGINAGASPSLDYALTDLMGRIAEKRQGFLSNLSAQQYGGNKALATGNYQNVLDQMYGQNQQQRQQQQQYGSALLGRGFEGGDYQTQMNDYMRYLSQQPKQQGGNALTGALYGAGALAPLGPYGALAGAGLGAYSYLNR